MVGRRHEVPILQGIGRDRDEDRAPVRRGSCRIGTLHIVRGNGESEVITWSGRSVWPKNCDYYTGEAPSLEDISVGLGRQSRFGGQTTYAYTVLNHILAGAQLAEFYAPGDDDLRRHVLLHDAAEAVMGDCVTTWKPDGFVDLEMEILDLVCAEHGLEWSRDSWRIVKAIDRALLMAEAHVLGHREAEKWWPQSGFGELSMMASWETTAQVVLGKPAKFFQRPEYAIASFMEAWDAPTPSYADRQPVGSSPS